MFSRLPVGENHSLLPYLKLPFFQVTCTKHIFNDHVVFQFKCTNTIEEQVLENVSVVMDAIEGDGVFEEINTIPLRNMPLGQAGSTFVVLALTKVRRLWHSETCFRHSRCLQLRALFIAGCPYRFQVCMCSEIYL